MHDMPTFRWSFAVIAAWACVSLCVLHGAVLSPTGITVIDYEGGDDSAGTSADPFVDDACIDSITFAGGTYSRADGDYSLPYGVSVISGRSVVNAEYGDSDTADDGDADPFTKAGYPGADEETTDPTIQDASITETFGCTSLVEGIDGEGASYTLRVTFDQGIADNSPDTSDSAPELVLFERGLNSSVEINLITGGTWNNPTFSGSTVSVGSSDWWGSGAYADTTEIGSAQQLGGLGLDLDDFGVGASTVYGYEITSVNDSGADLHALMLTALDPSSQFSDTPSVLLVPEPSSLIVCGLSVAALLLSRRRRFPTRA